jgi:hypothetical protein
LHKGRKTKERIEKREKSQPYLKSVDEINVGRGKNNEITK